MDHRAGFDTSATEDARYRLLVEAVTDYAIFMLDPGGIVSSWNAGAQRIKGYTPSEILGQHFSRFYPEEDRANGLPKRALETAAHEGRFEHEGWRLRKDGSRFWAHVVIDPILGEDGTLLGFAKVTRDLTERKAAEEALRQSEQRFKLLVEGVTDYAMYMLDPDGRVTNWNPGAQRIKGYTPDEIIGEHFSRFYTATDREAGEPQRALETALRDGRFEKESWRVRKDGTPFWANIVIDPIRAEDGTLLGFAKITRDMTEKHEAQLALENAREQLFQSQKMEAIGQLTGGVAHDFNNLLMAILGSLELVRKRLPNNPDIARFLDNAILGAERGAALTQRMLAFARRQKLDPTDVDLTNLVRGMADLLQRTLGSSVSIATHFPLKMAPVFVDPNQLELALLNLAVNARDAMRQGGEIVISAREETVGPGHPTQLMPGPYACLSVTDTGEGMDPATLARAAEPFFTTKGAGKGTGLGLSAVHGVAEQSGGRLVLHSKLGEGTTAEIWLPRGQVSEARPAQPEPEPPIRPVQDPINRQSLVILAVDDDSLVLLNMAEMLRDLGHTVFQANSAARALELFQREKLIDLVITDQSMPQMTGAQLADALHAQRPALPVILATGYAELPPEADRGLPMLVKPFRQQELARAIRDVLETDQATPH